TAACWDRSGRVPSDTRPTAPRGDRRTPARAVRPRRRSTCAPARSWRGCRRYRGRRERSDARARGSEVPHTRGEELVEGVQLLGGADLDRESGALGLPDLIADAFSGRIMSGSRSDGAPTSKASPPSV